MESAQRPGHEHRGENTYDRGNEVQGYAILNDRLPRTLGIWIGFIRQSKCIYRIEPNGAQFIEPGHFAVTAVDEALKCILIGQMLPGQTPRKADVAGHIIVEGVPLLSKEDVIVEGVGWGMGRHKTE